MRFGKFRPPLHAIMPSCLILTHENYFSQALGSSPHAPVEWVAFGFLGALTLTTLLFCGLFMMAVPPHMRRTFYEVRTMRNHVATCKCEFIPESSISN